MEIELFKAAILGIVQGITEFFPISSTAHLIILPWFFGWEGDVNTLTFDTALHGGTLLALILCFYKDWLNLFFGNKRMLLFILIATIPAGLTGIFLKDIVEHSFRNPLLIVLTLIGFGILMLLGERYNKSISSSIGSKEFQKITLTDAILIGLAQSIALIPGVSRSGVTITAGLFRNLTRESAARFSFLISTPIIAGATIFQGRDLILNHDSYSLDLFAIGFFSAFISGFFAIKFLLNFLKRHPLYIFVYYRFALAGIILIGYLNQLE